MAESTKSFGESLAAEVRAGRSFGGHPLWFKIQEGRLARPQVQGFAKQFFLHSRCTDMGERVKLAESVYEEETGRLSGSKAHPELFLDFATGLGLPRHEVLTATAMPSTAALIHWFEYSTKILPFLEGVAAINLAAEGQVVGAFGPFARGLQKHYGLDEAQVAFWDVHELADAEHSDVGDHIVIKGATTPESQDQIRRVVRTSLGMWWQFFQGMDQAYGQV